MQPKTIQRNSPPNPENNCLDFFASLNVPAVASSFLHSTRYRPGNQINDPMGQQDLRTIAGEIGENPPQAYVCILANPHQYQNRACFYARVWLRPK